MNELNRIPDIVSSGDILVIDDDLDTLEYLSAVLTNAGYHVRLAKDGELALRSIKARTPELILLDIMMPGIDGIELCHCLKLDPKTGDIPVIFISSLGETELKVQALQSGAVDYITKPFDASEILARINTHLTLYLLRCKLEKQSQVLSAEIEERKIIQAELEKHRSHLEDIIEERTQSLWENETKYRSLFENMVQGVFYQNAAGVLTDVNPSALGMLGLTYEEFLSKTSFDPDWNVINTDGKVIPGDRHPSILALRTGKPIRDTVIGVYNFCRNEYRWLNINAIPQFKPGEAYPYQVFVTLHDVTDRKKNEIALMKANERFELAQNVAGAGVWDWDVPTGRIEWSSQMFILFGLDPNETAVSFETWEKILHPADLEFAKSRIIEALRNHIHLVNEYRIIKPGGEIRWIYSLGKGIYNRDDQPLRMTGICIDITERRRAEDEIRLHVAIMETVAEGVYLAEFDSCIIKWTNRKFEEMFGYNPGEMIGMHIDRINAATERTPREIRISIVDVLRRTGEWQGEIKNIKKNGTIFWCYARVSLFDHPDYGQVSVATHTDITERKRAEDGLRLHSTIMETVAEGIFLIGLDDNIIRWTNRKFEEMFGYQPGEMIGMHVDKINAPTNLSPTETRLSIVDVLRQTGEWQGEIKNIKKDGSHFWCHIRVSLFDHPDYGRVMVSTHTDITERKQIDDTQLFLLQCGWPAAGEDFFQSLARHLAATLRMDYVSISRLTGDNLSAQTVAIYLDGHFEDNRMYALKDTASGDTAGKAICCIPKDVRQRFPKDTMLQDMNAESFAGVTLWSSDGFPIGLIALRGRLPLANPHTVESILKLVSIRAAGELERRNAEAALRNSEALYHSLVEKIPLFIIRKDLQGRIMFANENFCRKVGMSLSEIKGKTDYDLYPLELAEKYQKDDRHVIETGEVLETVEDNPKAAGELSSVHVTKNLVRDANDNPVGVQVIFQDVTELKKLERQLLQSQKLEAMGTLAGGIAHDFNNILMAIIGFTELSIGELDPTQDEIKDNLNLVLSASSRAKNLVQQILSFSRKSDMEKISFTIVPLVKECIKLLRSTLPSTIEIKQDIECTDTVLYGNITQIQQVMMNLCTNAAHAMREKGGLLEIKILEEDIDSTKRMLPFFECKPGRYVALRVKDTGSGIDPAIQDKIFDPFFTTKDKSEGTGLGLSVILGIVKSHDGAIALQSKPGEGSVFTVYLPVSMKASTLVTPQSTLITGHGERILLVDDEETLLWLGKRMLETLGYSVISIKSSLEALETFRENPANFDLVLTDQTMPKMKGIQLACELISIRPDIPILLYTGYDEQLQSGQAAEAGIRELLMKPIKADELSSAIARALQKQG